MTNGSAMPVEPQDGWWAEIAHNWISAAAASFFAGCTGWLTWLIHKISSERKMLHDDHARIGELENAARNYAQLVGAVGLQLKEHKRSTRKLDSRTRRIQRDLQWLCSTLKGQFPNLDDRQDQDDEV